MGMGWVSRLYHPVGLSSREKTRVGSLWTLIKDAATASFTIKHIMEDYIVLTCQSAQHALHENLEGKPNPGHGPPWFLSRAMAWNVQRCCSARYPEDWGQLHFLKKTVAQNTLMTLYYCLSLSHMHFIQHADIKIHLIHPPSCKFQLKVQAAELTVTTTLYWSQSIDLAPTVGVKDMHIPYRSAEAKYWTHKTNDIIYYDHYCVLSKHSINNWATLKWLWASV